MNELKKYQELYQNIEVCQLLDKLSDLIIQLCEELERFSCAEDEV